LCTYTLFPRRKSARASGLTLKRSVPEVSSFRVSFVTSAPVWGWLLGRFLITHPIAGNRFKQVAGTPLKGKRMLVAVNRFWSKINTRFNGYFKHVNNAFWGGGIVFILFLYAAKRAFTVLIDGGLPTGIRSEKCVVVRTSYSVLTQTQTV
jgi:hypothetical protein